jgi:threonine/homoserine/homoserine lactone efflux protein
MKPEAKAILYILAFLSTIVVGSLSVYALSIWIGLQWFLTIFLSAVFAMLVRMMYKIKVEEYREKG